MLEQARQMAPAFARSFSDGVINDTGYAVDRGGHADGSGAVNTWKLQMGSQLDKLAQRTDAHYSSFL